MKLFFSFLGLLLAPTHFAFGGHSFTSITPENFPARPAARVYAPANYAPGEKLPLVVLLHGYSESPGFIDAYFGLSARVEARRFLLVVPEGLKNKAGTRYWNATDGCCDFEHQNTDDVGYLLSLVATLQKSFPVDSARIYATGHSNGGFMAHRLACEASNPFAAIASLAGVAPLDPAACASKRAISILQIHALNDDVIPYGGSPGYPGLKAYPSVSDTIRGWRERNACEASPKLATGNTAFSIPGDDTATQTWSCAGGNQVELRTIKAFIAPWHYPHTPFLNGDFPDSVLDFLFAHSLKI